MPTNELDDMRQAIEDRFSALATHFDSARRAREEAEALKAFAPGGEYQHLANTPVVQQVKAKLAAERAEADRAVIEETEHDTRERVAVLTAAEADLRRAPSARQAFLREHRHAGPEAWPVIDILDEMRLARLGRELPDALPSRVLATYEVAVGKGDATTVAEIERRHGAGWTGAASEDPAEAQAVLALRRAIAQTQEGRVDPRLRELRERLTATKALLRRAKLQIGVPVEQTR